jgi:hypothetical protein
LLEGIHNYFGGVGLPAQDLRSLLERVSELVTEGEPAQREGGGIVVTWRDTCGAAVSIFLDSDQSILGMLPYYTSARRNRVIPRDVEKDIDFPFYDRVVVTVVNRKNEGKFELTLFVQDISTSRDRLHFGSPGNMAITALASEWSCVEPDEPSRYSEITGQTGIVPITGSASLVNLRGHVIRVDEPLNRHSRVAFQHAKVKIMGVEIDALVPEARDDKPGQQIEANKILEGAFLLVGTLDSARHDATMAPARR